MLDIRAKNQHSQGALGVRVAWVSQSVWSNTGPDQRETLIHTHGPKLYQLNGQENQETPHSNHTLLNTDAQNNLVTIPILKNAQNISTIIPSCTEPNWTDIKQKIKE